METVFNKGITEAQIKQLIEFATSDPEVIRFTSDPERFKDRAAFDLWKQTRADIYTLSDNNGDLLGIIWFEKKPLESMLDMNTTFAIRVYGDARGKGLAYSFMEQAFRDYGAKKVWLRTSADNPSAINLYTKFGFRIVSKPDSNNKIVMLYEKFG